MANPNANTNGTATPTNPDATSVTQTPPRPKPTTTTIARHARKISRSNTPSLVLSPPSNFGGFTSTIDESKPTGGEDKAPSLSTPQQQPPPSPGSPGGNNYRPPSPFPWLISSPLARSSPAANQLTPTTPSSPVGGGREGWRTPRTPRGFEFLDFGADYFSGDHGGAGEDVQGKEDSDAAGATVKREPRSFDWEWWAETSPDLFGPSSPPSSGVPADAVGGEVLKRRLGPSEMSYYLGSRGTGLEGGVNDMYLHVGFRSKPSSVNPERVLAIWSEMRVRHVALASKVEFEGLNEGAWFSYKPPKTQQEAVERAAKTIEFRYKQEREALLDQYLNGPRTLSDERLAYLIISTPTSDPTSTTEEITNKITDVLHLNGSAGSNGTTTGAGEDEQEVEYDFWLFATHFLGDGMALHTFANEFFGLLGNVAATEELKRGDDEVIPLPELLTLPPAMESRIDTPEKWGRFAWAAARVDFNRAQGQLVGGQTFPRKRLGTRRTLVPTISFSPADTKIILSRCKAKGSTIAQAVFALANLAHVQLLNKPEGLGSSSRKRNPALPTMLYSALNLRPYLTNPPNPIPLADGTPAPAIIPDYFSINIGYYNVILPTFIPKDLTPEQTFWLRAKSTKAQSAKAVKCKLLAARSKLMSLERERRSIGFEREDEKRKVEKERKEKEKAAVGLGLGVGFGTQQVNGQANGIANGNGPAQPPVTLPVVVDDGSKKPSAPSKPASVPPPSLALMGVSMLGNLDGMYKHDAFPGVTLHTLTTGSRQRPGGMLLFAYTFAKRLWFSLGYDANGFEEGVVDRFWEEMQIGIKDFLLVQ